MESRNAGATDRVLTFCLIWKEKNQVYLTFPTLHWLNEVVKVQPSLGKASRTICTSIIQGKMWHRPFKQGMEHDRLKK